MSDEIHEDHHGPDCQQCRAMALQNRLLSNIAGALEKMLDDGVFERMGREYAERRERVILEAITGKSPA